LRAGPGRSETVQAGGGDGGGDGSGGRGGHLARLPLGSDSGGGYLKEIGAGRPDRMPGGQSGQIRRGRWPGGQPGQIGSGRWPGSIGADRARLLLIGSDRGRSSGGCIRAGWPET